MYILLLEIMVKKQFQLQNFKEVWKMTTYRTKTYIAGDWDHDEDAVNKLHQWNNSNYWSLSFTDAHEINTI